MASEGGNDYGFHLWLVYKIFVWNEQLVFMSEQYLWFLCIDDQECAVGHYNKRKWTVIWVLFIFGNQDAAIPRERIFHCNKNIVIFFTGLALVCKEVPR